MYGTNPASVDSTHSLNAAGIGIEIWIESKKFTKFIASPFLSVGVEADYFPRESCFGDNI